MYKILCVFILFFKLFLMCNVQVVKETQFEECKTNNFFGYDECLAKLLVDIEFKNTNEIVCLYVKAVKNNTIIGIFQFRIIEVIFKPIQDFLYFTSGLTTLFVENKIGKIFFGGNNGVSNFCQGNNNFLDSICVCHRECREQNEKTSINKACYGMFDTKKDYFDNKLFFEHNISKIRCISDCNTFSGFCFLHFYNYLYKINASEIFMLSKYLASGDSSVKVEVNYTDLSGINKTINEKDNFFSQETTQFVFSPNKNNRFSFRGITFFDDTLVYSGGSFTPDYYLTPYSFEQNHDTNCYYTPNINTRNRPYKNGVGEIQGFDINHFFNGQASIFYPLINFNEENIYLSDNRLKITQTLLEELPNPDYPPTSISLNDLIKGNIPSSKLFTKNDISINNRKILTDSYRKLPQYNGKYKTFCDNNYNIYSIYEGQFKYILNFQSNTDYKYIIHTNEVKPLITNIVSNGGYFNCLVGAFVVIKAKAQLFDGSVKVVITHTDTKYNIIVFNILENNNIYLTKNENSYNISFLLGYNPPGKLNVKLNIVLIDDFNNNNTFTKILYFDGFCHPDTTTFTTFTGTETKEPAPPPNPDLCFTSFFNFILGNSLICWITKGSIILGVLIILIIILCLIFNRPQQSGFLPITTTPQPIIINIPKSE